jgi:hypothetical protein
MRREGARCCDGRGLTVLEGLPGDSGSSSPACYVSGAGRRAAVELFWEAFLRVPSLTAYRRLLDEAGDDVSAVKTRALEALTSRVERPDDGDGRGGSGPSGVLVAILAFEGDTEQAWQVAIAHGCDRQLWLTLARALEDSHPLDGIGLYEPEVFVLIEAKKNATYRQAVDLLGRVRGLARQVDQPQRFEDILQRVRAEHGANAT